MTNLITSDNPLSTSHQTQLLALLDTLIPASEDGQMPSATEVGFEDYLLSQGADSIPAVIAALEQFDDSFCDQPLEQRCEHVQAFSAQDPELFQALLTLVYDCYYQHDSVRDAIGMIKGAVFPQGNEVMAGDLSLLDPVMSNSDKHQYRRA